MLEGDEWLHAKAEPVPRHPRRREAQQAWADERYAAGKITLDQWRSLFDTNSMKDAAGEFLLPAGMR